MGLREEGGQKKHLQNSKFKKINQRYSTEPTDQATCKQAKDAVAIFYVIMIPTNWIDILVEEVVCRSRTSLTADDGGVFMISNITNARPFYSLFSLVHNLQIRPLLFITYKLPKIDTIPAALTVIDYHEWHIMDQVEVQKALTCAFYIPTSLRYVNGMQRCLNGCDDAVIAVVGVTVEGIWYVYGSSDEKELRCILIDLIKESLKEEYGNEFEGGNNISIVIHSSTSLLAELDLSFDRVEIKQMDELHLTPCDPWVAGDGNINNIRRPLSLFVLAGQSNMAGRGKLMPPFSVEQKTTLSSDQCHCCHDQTILGIGVDSTSLSSSLMCHRCYVSLPYGVCQAADAFRSRVISYDPLLGWTHEAGTSLHANVDILKRATVGIGPGSSFAIEYLRLWDLLDDNFAKDSHSTTNDNDRGSVGLIPVSVGSTFLAEWTADYLPKSTQMPVQVGQNNDFHVPSTLSVCTSSIPQPNDIVMVLDYDISDQGFVNVPTNAQYHHNNSHDHPGGCFNLISCAMRSIYRALVSLPAAPHHHDTDAAADDVNNRGQQYVHALLPQLTGLLWYQGENDCSSTSNDNGDELSMASAETYGERCAVVIGQFRMLMTAVTMLARMTRGEVDIDAVRGSLRELIITGTERDTRKDKCDNADADQGTTSLGDQGPRSVGVIPVVSVAVTTTRPWLVHLSTIRQQQLAMPKKVAQLSVVDAFGCALQSDGNNQSLSHTLPHPLPSNIFNILHINDRRSAPYHRSCSATGWDDRCRYGQTGRRHHTVFVGIKRLLCHYTPGGRREYSERESRG